MTVTYYDAPALGENWPFWMEEAKHQIAQEVTIGSIAIVIVTALCFALLFGSFQRSVFWKPSDENWHDWFWRVVDIVALGAGVSAGIWSMFWLLGFALLVLLSKRFGVPTETSALAISFAVLLGHLPKFASNLFGTDTDFEDFVARFGGHSLQDAYWARLFLASCIIMIMFKELIPTRLDQLVLPLEPTDIETFLSASKDGALVVVGLFLIQTIFSWPKRILTGHNQRIL